jgi:hypothetical protein
MVRLRAAPKGASQLKEFTASLKRCPDTKPGGYETGPLRSLWDSEGSLGAVEEDGAGRFGGQAED